MTSMPDAAMKILVIDDDDLVREYLSDLLDSKGFDVVTAANGAEGIEEARRGVDLILSDICMPGLSGLDLLDQLSELGIEVPVILLTGYGDMKSAIKAIRKGAFDYMLKPIETDSLLMRISHIQKLHDLEKEAKCERHRSMTMARMAAVGQLAAGVAHEINNPTTYIRGNAQIIRALEKRLEKALDDDSEFMIRKSIRSFKEQIAELLEGIEEGTERIKKITLSLSRFANGQAYEPHEDGYINACIEDALMLMGNEDDSPTVELSLKDDIRLVSMSRRNITQALACLINNAFQAARAVSSGIIRISSEELADCVRVIIEDSGRGVPEEIREKVFDPFFTTREVNEGAGLGLAVAYGIICSDHGGTLRLEESRLGGAKFIFELPAESKVEEVIAHAAMKA
ncbi:MAG: response regulator [Planctomycetes bacterium]|nr:response regulator [Planctomycetota bacterium]